MCGWEIKICTHILHRGYRSRDIAHAQWRFAMHFGAEYLEMDLKRSRSWPRYRKMQVSRFKTVRDRGSVPIDQLTTNRKWRTWPMTSRDLERSRWWLNYVWGLISQKRLFNLFYIHYTVWVKEIHPLKFSAIFSQTIGNVSPNFTRLLYVHTYAGRHLNYLRLWRSYAILSATTLMCSKCPLSTESLKRTLDGRT